MFDDYDIRLAFHRDSPFFQMMMAYITGFAGVEALIAPSNPMGYEPPGSKTAIAMAGKVYPQFAVWPYDVRQKYLNGTISQPDIPAAFACMLINTAYETVKLLNDRSPEFEFFRHIRNASSHSNRFNFHANEPSRPASWRGLTIDHALKGSSNPLHGTVCFFDFLGPGDPLFLLSDIQLKVFQDPEGNP